MKTIVVILTVAALLCACAVPTVVDGRREFAVSANEGKVMLVDGKTETVEGNDSLTLLEITGGTAKVVSQVVVPGSIIGPPSAVVVTPDGALALVTSGARRDPVNRLAPPVANDVVSVVDLRVDPIAVISTVKVGSGAAGISINAAGTLALVANRNEGTVSVLSISGRTVTATDKLALGDAKAGPSHVAITPNGKRALVTRDGDSRISVLDIDGQRVKLAGRDLFPGQRPYGLAMSSTGDVAVVANVGIGQGDADTVSLIDLTLSPPRVVDTVSVGPTPEGIAMSADGRYVGVNVLNGSNKARSSPFFNERGRFVLLRIDGRRLRYVTEAPIGAWSQGLAFATGGRRVLIQNAMQKEIQVLAIDNDTVSDTGQRIGLDAAPSSIYVWR